MSSRTIAFVLASTAQGTLIVNRLDHYKAERAEWGVGFELLRDGSFSATEVGLCLAMLKQRRQHFGDGVFAIDCGANIGVHTIEWARLMSGWGEVLSIEAQERIFLELRPGPQNEPIGQSVSYHAKDAKPVKLLSLDSLGLTRLDLIKIDIEGMEEEALSGAKRQIETFRPILLVERIKSRSDVLDHFFNRYGYKKFHVGMNDLAIHRDDPSLQAIRVA